MWGMISGAALDAGHGGADGEMRTGVLGVGRTVESS